MPAFDHMYTKRNGAEAYKTKSLNPLKNSKFAVLTDMYNFLSFSYIRNTIHKTQTTIIIIQLHYFYNTVYMYI